MFTIYYYIILLSLFYFINRINEVEQASIVRIQAAVGMKSIACIDYRHTFFCEEIYILQDARRQEDVCYT